jgi:pimeloyl-ACP methyl ester carboxylesterase
MICRRALWLDNHEPFSHKRFMHFIVKTMAGIAVCYCLYCILVFLVQRSILFPRNQIPMPSPAKPVNPMPSLHRIWLEAAGAQIEAWFIAPAAGATAQPAPAVIFAHGNGELIDDWPEMLQNFSRMGIGLLLVEYPGYGRSSGTPTKDTIAQAFVAAYDTLVSYKEVDPRRIILFGRSVGGGAVCALALKRPAAALILMSTFTSVRSMASKFLVPPFLIRDPFDNLEAVRQYRGPLLLIHGRHDRIVPYENSVRLHRAAHNSSLLDYNAGHNDCPPDWKRFWKDAAEFFAKSDIVSVG